MPLDPSAQDIKSVGLGKTFTWDLFIVFPYELLSLYFGSISHKFSIRKFLLIFEHETTASYGQLGISFSISSRPRNMLYHLDYSHVLAIYSFCLWRLTAQQGKIVFWKLWEFNHQPCPHGLSSKVLGLIKGNVTFGSVHCYRAQVKAKHKTKQNEKQKSQHTVTTMHQCSILAILHFPICLHFFSFLHKSECVCVCVCVCLFLCWELQNIKSRYNWITYPPLLQLEGIKKRWRDLYLHKHIWSQILEFFYQSRI